MKSFAIALLVFCSGIAHAACESGQFTALKTPVEFFYKQSEGNVLKISVAAGTQVHLILINSEFTELMATVEFQNQPITVLADIATPIAPNILNCSPMIMDPARPRE